jgi:hypothetical protein
MSYSQRHRNNTLVGSALLGQKTFGQMTFVQHANDILILSNVLTKYLSAKWLFNKRHRNNSGADVTLFGKKTFYSKTSDR